MIRWNTNCKTLFAMFMAMVIFGSLSGCSRRVNCALEGCHQPHPAKTLNEISTPQPASAGNEADAVANDVSAPASSSDSGSSMAAILAEYDKKFMTLDEKIQQSNDKIAAAESRIATLEALVKLHAASIEATQSIKTDLLTLGQSHAALAEQMKKDTKALLDRLGNVNSGASLEQWIAQSSAAMAALMTVVYGENGTSGLIGKVDSLARQSDAEALVLKNLTTQFATLAETDATLQAAISQLSSRLEKHVTDNDLHTEELKLLKMALQQALKAVSTNPSSTTLPVTPEFNAAAATLLGLLSELETLGTEMLPLFMQIQQDSLAALLNGTAAATCKLDGAPLTDIGLMLGRIESVGPLLKTLPALADLHTHTLTCDGVAYTVIVPF